MRTLALGAALGVALLSGCSKPAIVAGPIALSQLPAPTAGAWTWVSSQNGGPPTSGPKCMDGKPIDLRAGLRMTCPSLNAARTATGGFTVVGDCREARITLAGEGDFSKSFSTDATVTLTGDSAVTLKTHSTYTYLGPTCAAPPSGRAPG